MQAVSVLKRKRLTVRGAAKKRSTSAIRSVVARQQRQKRSLRLRNAVTMGFLGIEKKFYDTALTLTALTANTDLTGAEFDPSTTSMISTPAVGDSEQNREGKRINILSVEVDGNVQSGGGELGANVANGIKVYVALVLDKQSNGAQMNSEDCFKSLGNHASLNVCPQRNLLFATRFQVLKKQVFDITPNTLSHFAVDSFSWNGVEKTWRWFLRFPKGLQVNFNAGTTASIANVIDNSLHIIAFATSTAASASIAYNARIRFVG